MSLEKYNAHLNHFDNCCLSLEKAYTTIDIEDLEKFSCEVFDSYIAMTDSVENMNEIYLRSSRSSREKAIEDHNIILYKYKRLSRAIFRIILIDLYNSDCFGEDEVCFSFDDEASTLDMIRDFCNLTHFLDLSSRLSEIPDLYYRERSMEFCKHCRSILESLQALEMFDMPTGYYKFCTFYLQSISDCIKEIEKRVGGANE